MDLDDIEGGEALPDVTHLLGADRAKLEDAAFRAYQQAFLANQNHPILRNARALCLAWEEFARVMELDPWPDEQPERATVTVAVVPFERTGADATFFGSCPQCRGSDGFLNLGRSHWGLCDAHQVKWPIGSNLFSSWQDETEADWARNASKLDGYVEVEPFHPAVLT